MASSGAATKFAWRKTPSPGSRSFFSSLLTQEGGRGASSDKPLEAVFRSTRDHDWHRLVCHLYSVRKNCKNDRTETHRNSKSGKKHLHTATQVHEKHVDQLPREKERQLRRRKINQIYLYGRNFIGRDYGVSEIFLRPRKTTVCNFSCEGRNGVFLASLTPAFRRASPP